MKQLHISDELSLPIDAATQTFAFIARKGAGKTYAAGKLAECLIDANVQVVVLDAVGNWWGLRLAADGKTPAYDIPVIGGLRGDTPLEATGGHLIADIITDSGRSLIIDISQFNLADRQRFATALGERLWATKKAEKHPSPVHLIIEESQLFVPQMVKGDKAKMVGIFEEIIRLGRNYGIGVSMITQRPQSVNKEVLNMTECLFVLQVNGAQERKSLKDWITYHGVEKGLVDELPTLPVGTAFVWSPQWLQILKKVKIGKKKTFDASATPKVGSAQVRRELKPLNLDDLKERMAATIEKTKADDPKELRKQIAELKKQVAAKTPAPVKPVETVKEVEKPILKDAQIKRLESFSEKLSTIGTQLVEAAREITAAIGKFSANGHKPASAQRPSQAPRALLERKPAPSPPIQPRAQASGDVQLNKGEMEILRVVVQFSPASGEQIAVLTGYKATSRYEYLRSLTAKGLITKERDEIFPTDAGIQAAGEVESPPTGSDLIDWWRNRLSGGELRIFELVASQEGDVISRDFISDHTGYKNTSIYEYSRKLVARKIVESTRGGYRLPDLFL